MTVLLSSLRLYLRTLARFAPRAAGRQAYQLFRIPRRRPPVPPAAEPVMARAERFDVEAGDHRVAAYRWRVPGEGLAEPPRVLLVHGWESRAARLAVWVDPLLEAGFEVLAFDAPAHGASTGRSADPLVFVRAMRAVIARLGPAVASVGHSMGGYASLLAAGGGHLLGHDRLAVERLVIVAGAESGVDAMAMFCDVLGLGEGFLPLILGSAAEFGGRPMPDFDAHRFFVDHPVPTLWLHDPEDEVVPIEGAERVDLVCPHVTLERLAGLGHHRIARDPAVLRRGLEFFAEIAPGSRAV